MNYKFIALIAIGALMCITSASAQTILEVAENDSIFMDSEPELMGTYYVDNAKYYVVKHNNLFVGGISIYDEYGIKVEDEVLAEKVITAQQVRVDNETMNVLKDYTLAVSSFDSSISEALNSLKYLIDNLDKKNTNVNYDEIKTLFETLNSLKESTSTSKASCNAAFSKIKSLEKSKDYGTAYGALDEYEKCTSSIEPIKSNIEILKNQVEPASETMDSPEILKLALGNDELSRNIAQGLDSSINQVDKLKNLSVLQELNEIDTGILESSYEEIKSGIDSELGNFETRIDPKPRILKIIGIIIIIIIIIAAVVFIKRRGVGFELKKEKEEEVAGFGDLTVVVTESKTRDPVENASVALINLKTQDKYEGTTESNGNLILNDLITGEYKMEVGSKKHELEETEVIIDPGVNRSMIVLRRK